MLTTREVAGLLWTGVFFGVVLWRPDVRTAFLRIVQAFFRSKLLILVGSMSLYVLAVGGLLAAAGFWTTALLKDTILWFCFVAFPLVMATITTRYKDDFIAPILADNLRVLIVLEYLASTYTFPLLVEIALMPVAVLLAGFDVVTRAQAQYASVAKLVRGIQIALGLIIIGFSIVSAVNNWGTLWSIDTARSLLLTPILSILFIPCLFIFVLVAQYETLFVRLKVGPSKSAELQRYAERRLLVHLGVRPRQIRAFNQRYGLDLMRINSREDVDRLIASSTKSP